MFDDNNNEQHFALTHVVKTCRTMMRTMLVTFISRYHRIHRSRSLTRVSSCLYGTSKIAQVTLETSPEKKPKTEWQHDV